MQLTIEVLPAPFGPMIENSSPARTAKLTSLKALTPRNRSVTPRASRMGGGGAAGDLVAATGMAWLSSGDDDVRALPARSLSRVHPLVAASRCGFRAKIEVCD